MDLSETLSRRGRAGHLVRLDQPEALAALLAAWVLRQTWTAGD